MGIFSTEILALLIAFCTAPNNGHIGPRHCIKASTMCLLLSEKRENRHFKDQDTDALFECLTKDIPLIAPNKRKRK